MEQTPFHPFLQVSQMFQRCKSDVNKQDFENLVALTWTGDELSRGQAQNEVNFDFEVKFYLEGQGQSSQKQ